MANIKTAIDIDADLFNQIEASAQQMNVSRSHWFTLAAQELLRREENRVLAAQIDAVYGDEQNEDKLLVDAGRRHAQTVLEDW